MIDLKTAFAANPLIAILRGLKPDNACAVSDRLIDAEFRIIEVPLNSPQPLVSIRRIAERHGARSIVGAGTVLTVRQVEEVADAGGRIIVSPNMNPDVGRRAARLGLYWCPGVMTPSEAFAALDMGASVLKFFPAEMVPPIAIAAMRAVLPQDILGRRNGHAGERKRDVMGNSGLRQHAFGPSPDQAAHANRRNSERQVIGLPQQPCPQVRPCATTQNTRHETDGKNNEMAGT